MDFSPASLRRRSGGGEAGQAAGKMAIHTPAPTWIGGAGGRIKRAGPAVVNGRHAPSRAVLRYRLLPGDRRFWPLPFFDLLLLVAAAPLPAPCRGVPIVRSAPESNEPASKRTTHKYCAGRSSPAQSHSDPSKALVELVGSHSLPRRHRCFLQGGGFGVEPFVAQDG